ncbi:MAG: SHOCT domain-containing protein [Nitrospirae bacterium]|nr:SHOCT domain-containing protein [Nitrospirota bacterium]
MVIFWILILLGAVYLTKLIVGGAKRMEKEDTPFDILKKRYARGEITKDEFEEKKKDMI